MGLLLDLAVAALAAGVAISLGLLAWTLGISAGARIWAGIRHTGKRREQLARTERRLHARAAEVNERLRHLAARTARIQEDRADR